MHTSKDVLDRFQSLYESLLSHDGFGEIRVEVKILKRGQKEILLHCGKQYRFVVDYRPKNPLAWEVRHEHASESPSGDRVGPERRRQHVAIGFPERRKKD